MGLITEALQSQQVKKPATTPAVRMPGANVSGDQPLLATSRGERRKARFRGHVYAAVNALAGAAAGQAVQIGKQPTRRKRDKSTGRTRPRHGRAVKALDSTIERVETGPLVDLLTNPNRIQGKYAFVYSFVANLCLSGEAYIVADPEQDALYTVPTGWVRIDHSRGLFSRFKICDPSKADDNRDDGWLDGSLLAWVHLPDPDNPLVGLSPTLSQESAISIDDKIQRTQQEFFDNGVFPSVIITMGRNPHPDVPGGIRPRLSAEQRQQVYAAIGRQSSGVANYGRPAIVDGLIERIDRLSATQNELGWEKSEERVKHRILSAFGVHPFILGEAVSVGGYAQATIIKSVFAGKVECLLSLLGDTLTNMVNRLWEFGAYKMHVWFEAMEVQDPSLTQSLWLAARKQGDVSEDEFRDFIGLPPNADSTPIVIETTVAAHVLNVAKGVAKKELTAEAGRAIIVGFGIPAEVAKAICPEPPEDEEPEEPEEPEDGGEGPPPPPPGGEGDEEPADADAKAWLEALGAALGAGVGSI